MMSLTTRMILFALASSILITSPVSAAKPIALERAVRAVPESALFDVQLVVLDPAGDFVSDVRRAEARYIPVNLKQVLQASGYWGTVRVVPAAGHTELTLAGKVVASHGRELRLVIRATDATGKAWFDKTYKRKADASVYLDREATTDPFQDLYHQIANDLSKKYKKLKAKDIERIRDVARLRFAADLAPDAFSDYLSVHKNRYVVSHLPALDDPMMERVAAMRQRDAVFIDTVDAYYVKLFDAMQASYRGWRSQDYWQREAMKNGPPTATGRGGRNAPWGVLIAGDGPGQGAMCGTPGLFGNGSTSEDERRWAEAERQTHLDVLRELGESLAADVAPLVVEVDGGVTQLTGSVEMQYAKWRVLLRQIFLTSTTAGF